jgi:hypothetical protein
MVFKSIDKEVIRKEFIRKKSSSISFRVHQLFLLINLFLAFFEQPSSFSVTSDVRYKPQRFVFPYYILMTIEGLTLIWFLFYISTKVSEREINKREIVRMI